MALLDEMLDRIGCGRFQAWVFPSIALVTMAQSLQSNLLAFLQPCVGEDLGVTIQQTGESTQPLCW